jgi:hypothetical protein
MTGWNELFSAIRAGHLAPYLGPGMTAMALELQKLPQKGRYRAGGGARKQGARQHARTGHVFQH